MHDPTLFTAAIAQRFQAKVSVAPNGCWLWQAAKDRDGYGHFWPHWQKVMRAHRWSYEYHVGPIPEGLTLDHLCQVKACCNPDHLEPVTNRENLARAAARRPTCSRGHAYTDENTLIRSDGHGGERRRCRECTNAYYRKR